MAKLTKTSIESREKKVFANQLKYYTSFERPCTCTEKTDTIIKL